MDTWKVVVSCVGNIPHTSRANNCGRASLMSACFSLGHGFKTEVNRFLWRSCGKNAHSYEIIFAPYNSRSCPPMKITFLTRLSCTNCALGSTSCCKYAVSLESRTATLSVKSTNDRFRRIMKTNHGPNIIIVKARRWTRTEVESETT